MIVIIAVFGIALMIFSNVTRLSLSAKKLKAETLLQERLLIIEHNGNGVDGTIPVVGFHIEQKITLYDDNPHLSQVNLIAYDDQNNIVTELHKVIINP